MDTRYQQKVSLLFQNKETFEDPFNIEESHWIDDPCEWPPVEFGQIHTYLIESPGQFTKEKFGLQLLHKVKGKTNIIMFEDYNNLFL